MAVNAAEAVVAGKGIVQAKGTVGGISPALQIGLPTAAASYTIPRRKIALDSHVAIYAPRLFLECSGFGGMPQEAESVPP